MSSRGLPTISPMQPTLVRAPFRRAGWVYEQSRRRIARMAREMMWTCGRGSGFTQPPATI